MRLTIRVAAVVTIAATLASAAGCGSGSNSPGTNASDQAKNGTLTLDEKADGTTVHVHFGDTVVVTLHSTYWTFLPSGASLALQLSAPVATSAPSSCGQPMGSGCGSVTATYNVGHVGTTTLRAHRDTCGEALRCVGKQADWSVTVIAT